jgi:hypothetical protein
MAKKGFDCVAMQHEGGARVHAITKGMTVEEEVEYWRQRTKAMRARIEARRRRAESDGRTTPPARALLDILERAKPTGSAKAKDFDCVEMQHHGGQAAKARIGHLSQEEQLAYWERRTEELRRRLAALHPERGPVEHGK